MTDYAMHNGKWEPVVVLPVAEYEALLAIRARVEDDALADQVSREHWQNEGEANGELIAYRAALRGTP